MVAVKEAKASVKAEKKSVVNLTKNAEARAALVAFIEAKATIKAAEKARADAEKVIRAAMGEAEQVIVNGQAVIARRSRSRSGNKVDILKSAFPEAYEASLYVTEYDFLDVL